MIGAAFATLVDVGLLLGSVVETRWIASAILAGAGVGHILALVLAPRIVTRGRRGSLVPLRWSAVAAFGLCLCGMTILALGSDIAPLSFLITVAPAGLLAAFACLVATRG